MQDSEPGVMERIAATPAEAAVMCEACYKDTLQEHRSTHSAPLIEPEPARPADPPPDEGPVASTSEAAEPAQTAGERQSKRGRQTSPEQPVGAGAPSPEGQVRVQDSPPRGELVHAGGLWG